MIRGQLYVKDIDYESLMELAMPYLSKWIDYQDNLFLDLFNGIISKNGKPSKFSRFVVSVIPNKDSAVVALLPKFSEAIIKYLDDMILKQGILANVNSIHFHTIERGMGKMLKIELDIDKIDYEETIVNLTPMLLQLLQKQESKASDLGNLLIGKKELPSKILLAAIEAIPSEQRDALLSEILMIYKEELVEMINNTVTKNNILARVTDLKIREL